MSASNNRKTIFEALGRNPIHPFPARMAPGIALDALGESTKPLRVLDPMAGSGTVLAVARAKGHIAVGVDVDPLAVLLAGVWTRTTDPDKINNKAVEVLSRAKLEFLTTTSGTAYPKSSDEETRNFIRYWFDEHSRRQLAALAAAISRSHDPIVRDVLWCGFSRLIITKQAGASLAMDLSHSRPHKVFTRAPIKPFDRFISAVETVVSNCPQKNSGKIGPRAYVEQGDARQLSIKSKTIDVVLTSPPYLNAIDYMRCSKFSLVWMGYNLSELRLIRSESVGTEASSEEAISEPSVVDLIQKLKLKPALSSRSHGLLAQYAWDMRRSLAEASRVLKSGGRAIYVVGDCTTKGTFIRNSSIVIAAAEAHGLKLASRHARILPANRRYLPPPTQGGASANLNSRLRREVVVMFDKP